MAESENIPSAFFSDTSCSICSSIHRAISDKNSSCYSYCRTDLLGNQLQSNDITHIRHTLSLQCDPRPLSKWAEPAGQQQLVALH